MNDAPNGGAFFMSHMLQTIPVKYQRFALACRNWTQHGRDMKAQSVARPEPGKRKKFDVGRILDPIYVRWMVALREAENTGDLHGLIDLFEAGAMPPANVCRLFAKLLRGRELKKRRGGQRVSIFRTPEMERLRDAVALARDLQSGKAGTVADLVKRGQTVKITADLPPPTRRGRNKAIAIAAQLTGVDEAKLGEALAGRIGGLRR